MAGSALAVRSTARRARVADQAAKNRCTSWLGQNSQPQTRWFEILFRWSAQL